MPVGAATTSGGAPLPSGALTRRDGWAWRFASTARDEYDGAQAHNRDMDAGKNVTVTAGGSKRKKLCRLYAHRADAEAAAQREGTKGQHSPFTFEYALALGDPPLIPHDGVGHPGGDGETDGPAPRVHE